MNRLLILGILIISTAPLFAQAQQPNAAELAQEVVSIISGDKPKTQTYCQILDLSDELDQADQQKDREKAEWLSQKINELQKKLGPEYLALLKATEHVLVAEYVFANSQPLPRATLGPHPHRLAWHRR